MARVSRSRVTAPALLLVAAAALAAAVFVFDTVTPYGMAIAVLYVIVVLIAGGFLSSRGILLTAAACCALTVLSYVLQHGDSKPDDSLGRALMSLSAIGVTTLLVLRNHSAQAMRREQARLLDLTHDTVFVRDMHDVITYWNRAAEEMYGWTRTEAVGRVSHDLLKTIFPTPIEQIMADLRRAGRWEGELVHTGRQGAQIVVASRWSLRQDEHGTPLAILETNNDITERRRTEEALLKAQADLAHASRVATLGELAASIVHEVNQPISAIVANGDACLRWLGQKPPDLNEARDSVEAMIRDSYRAGEVVRRLRGLAKRTEPQKVRLDFNEIIDDVVLVVKREMLRHHVAARIELADTLPPVLGDRIQLQQVVLNLIMNALDAMASVTARPRELIVRAQPHGDDHIIVAVQDCGIGFDANNANRLFAAFFTTKPGGMGMGLAICRSIIEAHGGRLWASPNAGPGATFQFILPRWQPDASELPQANSARIAS
jgi:two-component system, LuxR family, sensor kinase FixL